MFQLPTELIYEVLGYACPRNDMDKIWGMLNSLDVDQKLDVIKYCWEDWLVWRIWTLVEKHGLLYQFIRLLSLEELKYDESYILVFTAKLNDPELFRFVMKAGLGLAEIKESCAFEYACFYGSVELAKAIMEEGIDLEYIRNSDALECACDRGEIQAVVFLLGLGLEESDIKRNRHDAITSAFVEDNWDCAKLLMEYYSPLDVKEAGLLEMALEHGDIEGICLVLETGVSKNEIISAVDTIRYVNHEIMMFVMRHLAS